MRPCFEALNDYSLIKYQNYPCFVIIEIVLRDHLLKKKKKDCELYQILGGMSQKA